MKIDMSNDAVPPRLEYEEQLRRAYEIARIRLPARPVVLQYAPKPETNTATPKET